MNILSKILALFFILFIGLANAQQAEDFRITKQTIVISTEAYSLRSTTPFNAISFRVKEASFSGLKLNTVSRTVLLTKDEHFELETGIQSNLIILNEATYNVTLNGTEGQKIECILQYVKPINYNSIARRRATCEHPEMVMQSTWRTGLPDPVAGRNKTPTEHCIVHHSADGNGNSDYTSLVRAYYTHHTQTNGWDDIGYNYLIANDGTLYAGRDPEKSGIEQDNVQGAHFCAKNQKTMGVCLIGEYTSVEPSFAAINTLTTLLTWKLDKEQYLVTDSFNHPTASDPLLSVIDGHKSACNTTCPGDNVWEKMAAIRQEVHNKLDQCSSVGIRETEKHKWEVFPNPSNGTIDLRFNEIVNATIKISDITGNLVYSKELVNKPNYRISLPNLRSGFYLLRLIQDNKVSTKKIQIIH